MWTDTTQAKPNSCVTEVLPQIRLQVTPKDIITEVPALLNLLPLMSPSQWILPRLFCLFMKCSGNLQYSCFPCIIAPTFKLVSHVTL